MKKNILIALLIIMALIVGYTISKEANFGGGMEASRSCDTTTETAISVGPNSSVTVLSATSGRSWARIQQPIDATSTALISFSDTATLGNGIELSGDNSTTTAKYLVFGMTTDHPYTGIVTAITDGAASSTLLISECR